MTLPATKTARRAGPVRFRDGGWELRCDSCARRGGTRFWPLTEEFWDPRWMTACRACHQDHHNNVERRRYLDPAYRRAIKDRRAAYRSEAREALNIQSRAWYAANRDEINERRRARYAARATQAEARAA